MSSPTHSNDMAKRRLDALGIATRIGRDGATLEGELAGSVRNPLGGKPFDRIRFVVEGGDRVRAVAPPAFEGLKAVPILGLKHADMLLESLAMQLERRAAAAVAAVRELERLRIDAELDIERAWAIGRLEITPLGIVVLAGDERGIRAVQLQPLAPNRPAVRLDVPIDLREHEHRVDIEVALFGPAERALEAAAATAPSLRASTPGPGTAGAYTLAQLIEKFGPEARVAPGFGLLRDVVVGDQAVRFVARHDPAHGFAGRLAGAQGTLWEDSFELGSLPPLEELAAAKLGAAAQPALQFSLGPAAAIPTGEALLGSGVRPVTGEVWVMSVLVEHESEADVRYVPVDVDGKAFGAPRTLPRADFLATFEKAGAGGYRLPARVVRATETQVTWIQLDPHRQTVGQVKTGALAVFVHHFVPEAAAY